ncbi:MAG: hypothetical protein KBA81_06865 [Rhabdochlamydiaceae bacterium]|nr:hypothetical protein [Rhabdochlamydiaceae bacterium]
METFSLEMAQDLKKTYEQGQLTLGRVRELSCHLSFEEQEEFIAKVVAIDEAYPDRVDLFLQSLELAEASKWVVVKLLNKHNLINKNS